MASNGGRRRTRMHQQDLSKLDVSALSPEVTSQQATMNIGNTGLVAHGKSTVIKVKGKKGKKTKEEQILRFKNGLTRNCTIKLERMSLAKINMFKERFEDLNYMKEFKNSSKRAATAETLTPKDIVFKKQKKDHQQKNQYIVENILSFKFTDGKEFFLIKWQGFDYSENTWEPLENLKNCPKILKDFLKNEEIKHCDKLTQFKEEISFNDLLKTDNLILKLCEIDIFKLQEIRQDLIINLLSMIYLQECEEHFAMELVVKTRKILQLYYITRERCQQITCLKNWEEYINTMDPSKKLMVENNVDLAKPPQNFTYINKCIEGKGVIIPKEPPIGCECKTCNCRSKSCCGMHVDLFPYTVNKRLRIARGIPIYECNIACKCSTDCNNRVVQQGRNIKLKIFRTDNGCGWGVKSEQKIWKGQFICEYVGEVITFDDAEERGKKYDSIGLTYLFDLDFNRTEYPYVVDGCYFGNVSHFINHSCAPNLGVWAAFGNCLDPNLPMLALFAIRDIEAGEQLNFDYLQNNAHNEDDNPDVNEVSIDNKKESDPSTSSGTSNSSSSRIAQLKAQQKIRPKLKGLIDCKCGAPKCRKYLF